MPCLHITLLIGPCIYTCENSTSSVWLTSTCHDRSREVSAYEIHLMKATFAMERNSAPIYNDFLKLLLAHAKVMSFVTKSEKSFFLFQIWWAHRWTPNCVTVSLHYQCVASTICPIVACKVMFKPAWPDWYQGIKEKFQTLCLLFLSEIDSKPSKRGTQRRRRGQQKERAEVSCKFLTNLFIAAPRAKDVFRERPR